MLMLISYYLVSSLSILLNNLCNYAMIIICYFDDVKSCDPLYIFDIITTYYDNIVFVFLIDCIRCIQTVSRDHTLPTALPTHS